MGPQSLCPDWLTTVAIPGLWESKGQPGSALTFHVGNREGSVAHERIPMSCPTRARFTSELGAGILNKRGSDTALCLTQDLWFFLTGFQSDLTLGNCETGSEQNLWGLKSITGVWVQRKRKGKRTKRCFDQNMSQQGAEIWLPGGTRVWASADGGHLASQTYGWT